MRQTRRQYLRSVASIGLLPASLAPTTDSGVWGWSTPDDAIIHSDDRPSWIIPVEGADVEERTKNLDALEDELERLDGNTDVIANRRHDAAGVLTAIAPVDVIGARNRDQWFNEGITSLEYIDESGIEINREVTLASPIEPEGEAAWTTPGPIQSMLASQFASGPPQPDGVAFDTDMSADSMQAAREVTEATGSDVSLPDTSTVTVSVVDTGVSEAGWLNDADGNTRLQPSSTNFVASGDPSGVGETEDGNGHGDWVAACYAARNPSDTRLQGFLPSAKVIGCKALDDQGSGSLSDIAAAIRHAADEDADIINLSLGSFQYSQSIQNALAYAVDQGSIPVAAAGNDRQATRWLAFPSSSEYAIGVGSTTVAPPEDALSAYYSNVAPHNGVTDNSGGKTAGAELDVAAPGCKLEAATGDVLTGTSMAGPVAGSNVGLYIADGGSTDLDTVREELQRTAKPIPKASTEEVGAGMPSAANLLTGTEPENDQTDAETNEAAARGAAYEYLSGSWYTNHVV